MATPIGSLVVNLQAETAAFRRELGEARKSVGNMERSLTHMGRTLSNTLAGFLTITAGVRAFRAVTTATMESEKATKRLEGVITATGGAAGRTAADIEAMASAMQRSTLFDDEEIKNAAAALLTFKRVQGDVFDRAIALSGDLSSIFGTDLTTQAVQLGKALEDPLKGLTALGRVGVTFTDAEKKKIKALMESNQLLAAQGIILDAVAGQVGGVAAKLAGDPNSLTAAISKARHEWDDFLEGLGGTNAFSSVAVKSINAVAEALRFLNAPTSAQLETEVALLEQMELVEKIREGLKASGADMDLLHAINPNSTIETEKLGRAERYYVEQLAIENELRREAQALARQPRPAPPPATGDRSLMVTGDGGEAEATRVKKAWEKLQREQQQAARAGMLWLDRNVRERSQHETRVMAEGMEERATLSDEIEAARRQAHIDMWAEEQAQKTLIWNNAVEDMQDSFASAFRDLLTGEVTTFKSFTLRLLSLWADMLAQMAAAQMAANLFGGLFKSGLTLPPIGDLPSVNVATPMPSLASSAAPSASRTVVRQTTVNLTVQAIDTQSAVQFIRQHEGEIGAAVVRTVSGSRAGQRRMQRGTR